MKVLRHLGAVAQLLFTAKEQLGLQLRQALKKILNVAQRLHLRFFWSPSSFRLKLLFFVTKRVGRQPQVKNIAICGYCH
jgi:hypothetical protein